jgi:hypothetical protein
MQDRNQPGARQPRGAVGKALLVYWATGSIVVAVIAYLAFNAMGC